MVNGTAMAGKTQKCCETEKDAEAPVSKNGVPKTPYKQLGVLVINKGRALNGDRKLTYSDEGRRQKDGRDDCECEH